ncbi:unnamed protein product [Paramecium sonneborni]|uniref:Uncharacterized protein n=1 Tax=Paramecium sonneborni TaxID=65129 RepID=A0A8S1R6S6_9CILI|nr:unnamed protein product [Paramecium sonneborni]
MLKKKKIKQFYETIFEEICQFSIDQQQYSEWISNKKSVPLINKECPKDPFDLEIERIKHEAQLVEEQQKAQEKVLSAEKNKKGAQKRSQEK